MTDQKTLKQELAKLLLEKEKRQKYNKRESFFPDTGPHAREKYSKHVDFMNKGATFSQRAFVASNRSGKTVTGAYEMTCHLTGEYPEWWEGRKFKEPIKAWAAGINEKSTKDILQFELLGSPRDIGSGMIPKDKILENGLVKKAGVVESYETVYVQHKSGGASSVTFKSYEQGRETFQGTKIHVILLDEEPRDYGIYTECLTRTASACSDGSSGIIICTFTPLYGLSEVVLSFLKDGKFPENGTSEDNPHKYVVNVGWEDVPHLSREWKEQVLASYSEHERDARSKGIPALGSGAIFPYPETFITVEPFQIPMWWPKAYGFDVGWTRTAAVWGARDPDTGIIYLYSEHYLGKTAPAIHASAIRARGDWIMGAVDPAGDKQIANQEDGRTLFQMYLAEDLHLVKAKNTPEAAIHKINQMLESGQLKVFSSLKNWLSEYRIFRRNEKGQVIKSNDHLMDATMYLIMTGMDHADIEPDPDAIREYNDFSSGRDYVTGY